MRQHVGPDHRPLYYASTGGRWRCGPDTAFTNSTVDFGGQNVWSGTTVGGSLAYQAVYTAASSTATGGYAPTMSAAGASDVCVRWVTDDDDTFAETNTAVVARLQITCSGTTYESVNFNLALTEEEILRLYGAQLRGHDRERYEAAAEERRQERIRQEAVRRAERQRLELERKEREAVPNAKADGSADPEGRARYSTT